MNIKRFTYIAGALFILIGVLGFIPGVTTAPRVDDPNLFVETGHGRLFGLFPVNVLLNVVLLALGSWAMVASKDFAQSRIFCKSAAILFTVLMVMGFLPTLNTLFGLMPLHSHNVWLHALFAIGTAYYGYVDISDRDDLTAPRQVGAQRTTLHWT